MHAFRKGLHNSAYTLFQVLAVDLYAHVRQFEVIRTLTPLNVNQPSEVHQLSSKYAGNNLSKACCRRAKQILLGVRVTWLIRRNAYIASNNTHAAMTNISGIKY